MKEFAPSFATPRKNTAVKLSVLVLQNPPVKSDP
jgi:hypothetical protein